MDVFSLGFTLIIGIVIGFTLRSQRNSTQTAESSVQSDAIDTASEHTAKLYELADQMNRFFEKSAHPKDLLDNDSFVQGVDMLASDQYSDHQLIEYYAGSNVLIGCMALEAMHRRPIPESTVDQIIFHLNSRYIWSLFFALRVLAEATRKPIVGAVLMKAPDWWKEEELLQNMLKEFIDRRLEQGERIQMGDLLNDTNKQRLTEVEDLINILDHRDLQHLKKEIRRSLQTQVDRKFLNSVGRLWEPVQPEASIYLHDGMEAVLDRMEKALTGQAGRSVILTGEAGVGKTTHMHALAQRLARKRLLVFEASAADLIAGQKYIGDMENRLRMIIDNLDRKRGVIWFIPNVHELLYAGRHRYNPAGILELLMPVIDSGAITVVGETRPISFEQLTREIPRFKTTFDIVEIEPLNNRETMRLAKKWADATVAQSGRGPSVAEETLHEALQMVKQFLGDTSTPGNLLDFLKLACQNSWSDDQAGLSIGMESLYVTLSQITGLPRAILDERQGLNINDLHALFHERVMGQSTAVTCLVERIAMIKAGLTDPSRPFGVFLFAGPTGTGKTEIAKTLAEFLFGSPDRMIRLDMSEFKTATAESRILGDDDPKRASRALVSQIRKQPFSVVLLDEFEKAHANIWDLFLQVFDDGRLTDRQGNTANFRHAIIILTSNLGATIKPGSGIGFSPDASSFSMHEVQKAIGRTFRQEFVNRLDRVVIFQPLNRAVMRNILFKELETVLQRRGLRNREWAVEWEESAINFLLEKGFTSALGARPLKRAIEQYLLAPLSITIVDHQHPEGDQFLFVRSENDRIEVEFIDPDAPAVLNATAGTDRQESEADALTPGVKKLILSPEGIPSEVELLEAVFNGIDASVNSDEWHALKRKTLQHIAEADFWQRPDCYGVLGQAEFMDRIQAACKTAGSLLNRLKGRDQTTKTTYSKKLITRLAEQLYLLSEAEKSHHQHLPKDAYLMIETRIRRTHKSEATGLFFEQLLHMYRQWSRKRRMRHDLILHHASPDAPTRSTILAINGLGAYAILQFESGLHVYEIPKGDSAYDRINAHVKVIGQPDAPIHSREDHLHHAMKSLDDEGSGKIRVVRRYRRDPSPLVRDTRRNYRTGLIDKVMGGNFDLFD
jgi:ATP-dependent Clp protease ATP-binding subunit ClpC